MALTDEGSVKLSFGQVLYIDGGVTNTLKSVEDGDGTVSALQLSDSEMTCPTINCTTLNATNVDAHMTDTTNPHSVDLADVGGAAAVHTHDQTDITHIDPYAATLGLEGTFEWETDKTKAQLETDGWTFNTLGTIDAFTKDGHLFVEHTQQDATDGFPIAEWDFTTALSGDFFITMEFSHASYLPGNEGRYPVRMRNQAIAVADSVTTNYWYAAAAQLGVDYDCFLSKGPGTYAALGSSWTAPVAGWEAAAIQTASPRLAIARYSGDLMISVGHLGSPITERGTDDEFYPGAQSGWNERVVIAETATFNKLVIFNKIGYAGWTSFGAIRRWA